jgi:DNA-binding response OmpR family regulator
VIEEWTRGVEESMDKKRILAVDDEPDLLEMLKMRLEANNYDVLTAYDGQEGLEKARNEKPDLIILDLMLPKIDGYKVCGLLKKDARYKDIPIIIFSAKAQEGDIKLGQELGAEAYITKPFEPQVLLGKIKELLKE